ncbi:lasso peptide biosynthesis PqqD family chaperone [Streptomyces celluloflavus]|uniref:lasso peptide biosynthesis PqqD family chaperone n=1 Tax=Streptomyces celluloflavus TaxID=58344 RepID=UPI0036CC2E51
MIALHSHITATRTGDDMVLLDQRSGKYWQLNETASLVLRALLNGATTAEAAESLKQLHPSAARRASDDVDELVQRLLTAQLISQERA